MLSAFMHSYIHTFMHEYIHAFTHAYIIWLGTVSVICITQAAYISFQAIYITQSASPSATFFLVFPHSLLKDGCVTGSVTCREGRAIGHMSPKALIIPKGAGRHMGQGSSRETTCRGGEIGTQSRAGWATHMPREAHTTHIEAWGHMDHNRRKAGAVRQRAMHHPQSPMSFLAMHHPLSPESVLAPPTVAYESPCYTHSRL